MKLLNFRKTDGQPSVENGVPHYRMEYECEVEITEDGCWFLTQDGFGEEAIGRTASLKTVKETGGGIASDLSKAKRGLRQQLSGWIGFEKTENGWRKEAVHWTEVLKTYSAK